MTTPIARARLRELEAAATPGELGADLDYFGTACDEDDPGIEACVSNTKGGSPMGMLFTAGTDCKPNGSDGRGGWGGAHECQELKDARLLAAARNALVPLLDELDRLEEVARHPSGVAWKELSHEHQARADAAELERDALKAQLADKASKMAAALYPELQARVAELVSVIEEKDMRIAELQRDLDQEIEDRPRDLAEYDNDQHLLAFGAERIATLEAALWRIATYGVSPDIDTAAIAHAALHQERRSLNSLGTAATSKQVEELRSSPKGESDG